VAPTDKLEGRDQEIFKERDRKLEEARELRRKKKTTGQRSGQLPGNRRHSLNSSGLKVHFRLRQNRKTFGILLT
jgi:hypothetical protein